MRVIVYDAGTTQTRPVLVKYQERQHGHRTDFVLFLAFILRFHLLISRLNPVGEPPQEHSHQGGYLMGISDRPASNYSAIRASSSTWKKVVR